VPAEAWSCQAGAVPDEPRPDRDLGAIAGLIGDATRMGILAALAEGERLLQLGWLRRAEGRSLRPAPDYDDRLAGWLGRAG
jgi:hypothetical protein